MGEFLFQGFGVLRTRFRFLVERHEIGRLRRWAFVFEVIRDDGGRDAGAEIGSLFSPWLQFVERLPFRQLFAAEPVAQFRYRASERQG